MTTFLRTACKRKGFTFIEIMIVVLIISVIIAVAVPSWLGARERSQARTCQGQLREIKYAKESWAIDNHKQTSDVPNFDELYPTYIKKKPECPAGGTYTLGAVNEDPTCSIGGRHSLDWR